MPSSIFSFDGFTLALRFVPFRRDCVLLSMHDTAFPLIFIFVRHLIRLSFLITPVHRFCFDSVISPALGRTTHSMFRDLPSAFHRHRRDPLTGRATVNLKWASALPISAYYFMERLLRQVTGIIYAAPRIQRRLRFSSYSCYRLCAFYQISVALGGIKLLSYFCDLILPVYHFSRQGPYLFRYIRCIISAIATVTANQIR